MAQTPKCVDRRAASAGSLLLLGALLLDFDRYVKHLLDAPPAGATDGRGGCRIEPASEPDVTVRGAHIVRRIEADPTEAGQPDLCPGVVRLGRAVAIGEKVAVHVARRQVENAGRRNEDVRVILAD